MTIADSRARAAWRRMCPDITDHELDAMLTIGMRGTWAQLALRAYRAGRTDAARAVGQQIIRDIRALDEADRATSS